MQKKLSIGKSVEKWDKLKRELPKKVAARCVSYFLESFRKQGWKDNTFQSWKSRKVAGKKGKNRNLLVKSGRLRRAVNTGLAKVVSWNLIRFEIDLPYAAIHNEGFDGTENVKSHKRRIKTKVKVSSLRTSHRTTVRATVGETQVEAHTRHMKMPKRKYMGDSKELRRIIVEMIQKEIAKIFP